MRTLKQCFYEVDKSKYTHLVVIMDTYRFEPHLVVVKSVEQLNACVASYESRGQKHVAKVFDLDKSFDEQIKDTSILIDFEYFDHTYEYTGRYIYLA